MTSEGPVRLVYTVSEAAVMLGVSRSMAYELVARGELDARRLGRRIYVTRDVLAALLGCEPPIPDDLTPAGIGRDAEVVVIARDRRHHRPPRGA